MEFRQLETFIEVANLKSFSKASKVLFITQPTVTNHIQNLEKELDTILINRYGKSITLTHAGNLFYKYAVNIINSCEMAKFDLASYKGKIQGHLHIHSSSVPIRNVLPNVISKFLIKHPDVTFTLSEKDSKEVTDTILNGESDFGIVGAKYDINHLEYIDLVEDRLLVIVPKGSKYGSENYSYISRDVLTEEKVLFREKGSGTRDLIEQTLNKNDIHLDSLNIIGYINDTESIKKLVSLGVGIGFISEKSLKNIELKNFNAFYIEGIDFKRKFYFAYHRHRQLSPLSDTFKEFILESTNPN